MNEISDLNLCDEDGSSLLHLAIDHDETELAKLLIHSGRINLNAKDSSGNTTLHSAVYKGNTEIAVLLIEMRVSLNALNCRENTPLHFAAIKGNTVVIECLMKQGAQLKPVNDEGKTPFQLALECQQVNSILSFIAYDALFQQFKDVILQDFEGLGQMTCLGGLLTMAAYAHKKNELIHLTFLTDDDLESYFELLKTISKPIDEIFIIKAGIHWIAGKFTIDQTMQRHIVFIDSLKYADSYQLQQVISRLNLSFFRTDYKIYVNAFKRQHINYGCEIFALDDARRLTHAERYLYEVEQLHTYLEAKKESTIKCGGQAITCSALPLTFMQTTQTYSLLDEVKKRSTLEQSLKINKKGLTAEQAVKQSFVEKKTSSETKLVNTKLDTKLAHIKTRNAQYLEKNTSVIISQEMSQLTLDGAKRRLTPS